MSLWRIRQQWRHPNGLLRVFSHCCQLSVKQMPPRPKLDPSEVTGSYLKGTGPGGQAINKTNSAVQLIHKPTGIVVKSQATRSRTQNQKIAMGILAEKVELQLKGEQSRAAIKAETKKKKKASREKKARRKYRRLEEEKRNLGVEAEEGKEEGSEEVDSTESDEPVDDHEGVNPDRKESGVREQMNKAGSEA
ncbi:peptide chain release factor [Histoplasma capsulatum var. duboisii H88]|uniref:Peptide chain release factor n=1 Tax=Ajellomyces capsulatus (strain H88) TaxID=544711 RepID=A0A8A1LG95_AJEC8|nr:peptide chain release factor [Histoplasma capsulatum var. duboisii H88]